MKAPVLIICVIVLASCRVSDKQPALDKTNRNENPCLNARYTYDTVLVFKKGDSMLPTKDFSDMIKYLESKGTVKLKKYDSLTNPVYNTTDVYLTHDIACGNRYVTQRFVLKNVTRTTCVFETTRLVKDSNCSGPCYPDFFFQQCDFADNQDRDSALKVIKWVFFHLTIDDSRTETLDYHHQYAQIVVGNKRLYLLKPGGFKPAEPIAVESAGYLRQYLKENKLD